MEQLTCESHLPFDDSNFIDRPPSNSSLFNLFASVVLCSLWFAAGCKQSEDGALKSQAPAPQTIVNAGAAEASPVCYTPVNEITSLLGTLQVGSAAEWKAPRDIIVHTPSEEVFVGVVHPAAALFERPFSLEGAQREHLNFICLMKKSGARVFRLEDILLAGTVNSKGEALDGAFLSDLRKFAAGFLSYDVAQLPVDLQLQQEQYRSKVISELHPRELVKIILQHPSVRLESTNGHNTGFTATYRLNPVMNMYFMRDQVITTAKGVVLGHFNAVQREVESSIAKFAYGKLGIKPIYEVTGSGRLEGGDFLPAGDTAFLGQGLRSNEEAAQQLLKAQAFGTKRVVIVKEPWKNQDQMHLDTYFNIAGEKIAILVEDRLNLRDASGAIIKPVNPERRLTIDVYELGASGYSKVVADADFQDYVEKTMGFTLIPISADDQLKYGINFLTVGEKKILAIDGVSQDYKDRLARAGIEATWMDFYNLTGGYGAAHCTTQAVRRQ